MRPVDKEWLHWLVVNIPGNQIQVGDVLAKYLNPTPQADTGKHINIFKKNIMIMIN